MFLDTPNVEKQSGFDVLPKSWYRAIISKAEGKDTQAGTGRYLSMTFDVIDGQFAGRKVFGIFNVKNPNELAVKIGQSDLKALAEALGHPEPFRFESEYLKFAKDKVCWIKVGQRKDKKTEELRNTISGFKPDGDDAIPAPTDADTGDLDSIPF